MLYVSFPADFARPALRPAKLRLKFRGEAGLRRWFIGRWRITGLIRFAPFVTRIRIFVRRVLRVSRRRLMRNMNIENSRGGKYLIVLSAKEILTQIA